MVTFSCRVIGTPEDWPENVSLDKDVFRDYPAISLRSLIKESNADYSDLLMVSFFLHDEN